MNRRREESGEKKKRSTKRTRTRRVVNLSQFRLFDVTRERENNSKTGMVADIVQSTDDDARSDVCSEREKFSRSLDVACSCTDFLYSG